MGADLEAMTKAQIIEEHPDLDLSMSMTKKEMIKEVEEG